MSALHPAMNAVHGAVVAGPFARYLMAASVQSSRREAIVVYVFAISLTTSAADWAKLMPLGSKRRVRQLYV